MKNQPEINLPKSAAERWLDMAAWVAVILNFALAFNAYSTLSETIPVHFNYKGDADGFGSRSMIFLLPIVSFLLVSGMIYVSRFPHNFNYLRKITPENAPAEYRRARLLLRVLNALISLMFMLLTWNTILVAKGEAEGLGVWTWVFLAGIMGVAIVLAFGWKPGRR